MILLREYLWNALPASAPGLTKAEIIAAVIAAGRETNAIMIDQAIADLRGQNSLRFDGARPSRYWRGPSVPPTRSEAAQAADREPWSDASIQRLRELWDEGLPTAEIGRRLDRKKNSVVGKAHRLDLPPRPSPIARGDVAPSRRTLRRRQLRNASGPTLPLLQSQRVVSDAVLAAASRERQAGAQAVTVAPMLMLPMPPKLPRRPPPKPTGLDEPYTSDRPHGRCQFITVDWTRPVRMCTAEVSSLGSSWCVAHRRRIFVRHSVAGVAA